jgi:hypothetical protein
MAAARWAIACTCAKRCASLKMFGSDTGTTSSGLVEVLAGGQLLANLGLDASRRRGTCR